MSLLDVKPTLCEGCFTWRHDSVLSLIASTIQSAKFSDLYVDLPGYISPCVLTGDKLRSDLLITLQTKCIYILELESSLGFIEMLKDLKFDEKCTKYFVRKIINTCIRSSYYIFCMHNKEWSNPKLLSY